MHATGTSGRAAVHDRVDPGLGLGAVTRRRRAGRRAEQRGQGGAQARAERRVDRLYGSRAHTSATAILRSTARPNNSRYPVPLTETPGLAGVGAVKCIQFGFGKGWGAAVQGHPAEALALAANDLGRRGLGIEPGWIVLTGGMTDAVAVPAGAVLAAHFTHLGSLFLP
ncbi:MAG: hypothetical protein ACRDOA_09095 [Streptosporangiaceae bacterium]